MLSCCLRHDFRQDRIVADYWLSYSSYEGPGSYRCGDGFKAMISVVLDAGIRSNFSGIRLLLAYKEESFNNLQIRDYLQTERRGRKSTLRDPLTNRRSVLTHRNGVQEGRYSISDATFSCLPILTIPFEVVLDRRDSLYRAELQPQLFYTESKYLRIAYDKTFSAELGSVVNLFETNVSFRHYYDSDPWVPVYCDTPRGIPVYSARILPIVRGPSLQVLPPSILQSIANAAIGIGWRSDLLSFGLVCKAWSCMLDTFFTKHTGSSPLAVVRSLELKPERALLMKHFHLFNDGEFPRSDNEEQFIVKCRAVLTILSCAAAIRSIHLPSIHASFREEFVNILLHLKDVEKCTIDDDNSHMGKNVKFNMGEVQQFVGRWPKLRKLDIAFLTTVSNRWDFILLSFLITRNLFISWTFRGCDEVPELQCKIENLRLRVSGPTGRGFIRFTSYQLQNVELRGLNGPLNQDLKAFLSVAAPSLKSLAIQSCPFCRQSIDEDYAIDAVMPQLCSLEELLVSGDLLSAQSIVMKGPGKSSSSLSNFSAMEAPALYLKDLADALESSGWKAVKIYALHVLMDKSDLLMRQEAAEVATRRNIAFMYEPMLR
ncbi:hypothetical protein C0989_005012 [Termitomyces sp. Mn162]|nr:hypothetical protein C0989_005012 [Termitomyces sp. Mn162]KAH0586646.1 hypothetical protein H2248_007862 [Termitomyces sp. 'cryptogamus']